MDHLPLILGQEKSDGECESRKVRHPVCSCGHADYWRRNILEIRSSVDERP
jgi:hypothetical protein